MRRHLDTLRLLVLALSFLGVVAMPLINLYVNARAAHAEHLMDGATLLAYDIVHYAGGRLFEDAYVLDAVKGSPWSATLFGHHLSDPLAVLAQAAARHGVDARFAAGALVPVVLALLFGRAFCGWICPAAFLYELADRLRALLVRLGVPVAELKADARLRYAVLVLGLATSAAAGAVTVSAVYPPAVLAREFLSALLGGAIGGGALFLAATLAFDLLVARRGFCRFLCPGGAVQSLLGRFRLLRVRRDAAACVDCARCRKACMFALDPMRDRIGQDCTNCGACVATCPTKALGFGVAVRDRKRIAAGVVAALLLAAAPASAHHVLGRPAYGTGGDATTPSSLTMETQLGRYFVTMMAFPGVLKPGEFGRIKFYAMHIETGERLDVPVTFTVRDDGWLASGREETLGQQAAVDRVYSQDFQFAEAGDYVLSAVFQAHGEPYRVDFPVRVGNPAPWLPIAAAAGAVALALAGAAALKRKRG